MPQPPHQLYVMTARVKPISGAHTNVRTNIVFSISFMMSEAGPPLMFMNATITNVSAMITTEMITVRIRMRRA